MSTLHTRVIERPDGPWGEPCDCPIDFDHDETETA